MDKKLFLPLKSGRDLEPSVMRHIMQGIMQGSASDEFIEDFLVLLRQKGESAEEIAAAALVMREHSVKLAKDHPSALDTCGTGGDGKLSLNISTLAAIVCAAAGVKVAKHGNRSISSVCGSADLLELLEIPIDLPVSKLEESLETKNFGFFFAPLFHPAMKYVMTARKKIQGKTLFNLLGPLSNPAGALHHLIGVYAHDKMTLMAEALMKLGTKNAVVVHGDDGMDEITLSATTHVVEFKDGKLKEYTLTPEALGLKAYEPEDFICHSKLDNKRKALEILAGISGPGCDIVSANAGAALYAAGAVPSIQEGVHVAMENIKNGKALKKLKELKRSDSK